MPVLAIVAHGDIHSLLYGGLAIVPICHLVRALRSRRYGAASEHAATSTIHCLLALLEIE